MSVDAHTYLFLIVRHHFGSFFNFLLVALCMWGTGCVGNGNQRTEVVLRLTFFPRTPWYEAHLHSLVLRLSWRYHRGGWSGLRMWCGRIRWLSLIDPLGLSPRSQCTSVPTQAHWKNVYVAAFLQNITLLLAVFVTLSKWNVHWMSLKTHALTPVA